MHKDYSKRLRVLKNYGVNLPQWSILSLIGMWPIPFNRVSTVAASHSEQSVSGSVAVDECQRALTESLEQGLLQITNSQTVATLHSFVKRTGLVGPVYGYPNPGDIDFTQKGASLYLKLRRHLIDSRLHSLHGYRVDLSQNVSRLYFRSRRALATAINKLWKSESVLAVESIATIGRWCVYWWEKYPKGYFVNVSFREGSSEH